MIGRVCAAIFKPPAACIEEDLRQIQSGCSQFHYQATLVTTETVLILKRWDEGRVKVSHAKL